jgi:hypothetical protein
VNVGIVARLRLSGRDEEVERLDDRPNKRLLPVLVLLARSELEMDKLDKRSY